MERDSFYPFSDDLFCFYRFGIDILSRLVDFRLRDFVLDGVNGGLDTAAEVEFAQQVLDVDFDGGFCQVQMAGDDFVAVSGGEVAEDFEFARGEGGECLVGARC